MRPSVPALVAIAVAFACGDSEENPLPTFGGTCLGPAPLVLDEEGTVSRVGRLPEEPPESSPLCGGAGEVTVAFEFALIRESEVSLTVGSVNTPVRGALLTSCDEGQGVSCQTSDRRRLPAGNHLAVVSGAGGAEFGLGLSAVRPQTSTTTPVPTDPFIGTCDVPETITVGLGSTRDLVIDWDMPRPALDWDCRGFGIAHVVQLNLTEAAALSIRTDEELDLELREGACDGIPVYECVGFDEFERFREPRLEAGRYTLVVRPDGNRSRYQRLTFEASAPDTPPDNRFCSNATPVQLDESVLVNTSQVPRQNPGDPICSNEPTLYYRVTLPAASVLKATSDSWLSLSMFDEACNQITNLSCSRELCSDRTDRSLAAGTYILGASSSNRTPSSFVVEALPVPSPPPGDSCPGALEVDVSNDLTEVMVDTTGATGELDQFRRDIWLRLNLPRRSDLRISISGRGSLEFYPTSDCNDALGSFRSQTDLYGVKAGSYLVRVINSVDICGDDDGRDTLRVVRTDPPPAPPNDSCDSQEELTFTGSFARIQGSFRGAVNDRDIATCGTNFIETLGPDTVYRFVLAQRSELRLHQFQLNHGIIAGITAACQDDLSLACIRTLGAQGDTVVLDGGTYFLHLDIPASSRFETSGGDYELLLEAVPED